MGMAEFVSGYLNYSSWFIKSGSKIEEEDSIPRRELVKKYEDEGLSAVNAYIKALEDIPTAIHPDENVHDEAVWIIEKADEDSWELLKAIVNLCPNDEALLGHIGAGEFENWIPMGYFSFAEELKSLIRTDPKWRIVAASSRHNPDDLNDFLRQTEPERK